MTTNEMDETIFGLWAAGDITNEHALRELCGRLSAVEREMAPLEAERGELRDQIGRVLAYAGGKAELVGLGRLTITAPSVVKSYDSKRLDELIVRLTADGYGAIAQQIAQARKESQRAGSLRIEREK